MIQKKGNCCSQTHESEGDESWVQEEEDQENKKIKRNEGWKKDEREIWWKKNKKIGEDSVLKMRKSFLRKMTKETELNKNISRKRTKKKKDPPKRSKTMFLWTCKVYWKNIFKWE